MTKRVSFRVKKKYRDEQILDVLAEQGYERLPFEYLQDGSIQLLGTIGSFADECLLLAALHEAGQVQAGSAVFAGF